MGERGRRSRLKQQALVGTYGRVYRPCNEEQLAPPSVCGELELVLRAPSESLPATAPRRD
jgi:hypothetical protein